MEIQQAAQAALELTARVIAAEMGRETADIKVVKEIVSVLKTLTDLGVGGSESSGTGVVMMPRVMDDG